MKKRIAFLAVAAVASCSALFAGCASSKTANLIALSSNWYALTTYKGIQPTFTEGNEIFYKEQLTYDVTFQPSVTGNSTYAVDYADGTYTAEFYATSFDAVHYTHEDYRADYQEAGEITAYCLKTELSIPSVTFTCKGESKTFENESVVSECYFLSCNDFLRPLYSRQTVKSTSPANFQANSLDATYVEIDCEYINYYRFDGGEVITVKTDRRDSANSATQKQSLNAANTLFDSAALSVAIRAMSNLSESLAQAISLYTPENGVQNFTLSGSSAALDEQERTDLTALLKGAGLYRSKTDLAEGEKDEIDTVAVNVTYGGTLSGVTQTYWFAAIDNKLNNTGRATMLKLSTPLAYGLGTLHYTLSEVRQTLWDGTD